MAVALVAVVFVATVGCFGRCGGRSVLAISFCGCCCHRSKYHCRGCLGSQCSFASSFESFAKSFSPRQVLHQGGLGHALLEVPPFLPSHGSTRALHVIRAGMFHDTWCIMCDTFHVMQAMRSSSALCSPPDMHLPSPCSHPCSLAPSCCSCSFCGPRRPCTSLGPCS